MLKKPKEFNEIDKITSTGLSELMLSYPKKGSRKYKSQFKKFIKTAMEYEVEYTRESLSELHSFLVNRKQVLVDIFNNILVDYRDVGKQYQIINTTLKTYYEHRTKYYIGKHSGTVGEICKMVSDEYFNESGSNYKIIQEYKRAQIIITTEYIRLRSEIMKHLTTIRLIKMLVKSVGYMRSLI